MVHPRPRRALRPSLVVRVSRVAVPSVMVGLLGLGVAMANWPGSQPQTAYPAAAVQPALTAVESPTASESNPRRTTTPSPTAEPTRTPQAVASAKATSKPKPKVAPTPALKVTGTKYATASLKVRTAASFESDVVDVVASGAKISVTSAVRNGFRFISYNDRGRWISNKYLSDSKPKVSSGGSSGGGGISSASCSKSSSIQSGLVPNAIKVYRALCARYPQISSFGGRRASGGFHGTGQAVDVMISNTSVGWDIAEWTRANARSLGVSEVIYYQKIWTVERSGDGWRPMSDRGSASANHLDHVHVSVY